MKRWDNISPGKLCTKLEESPVPRSLIGAVATAAEWVRRLVPMRQAQWNFSVQSNWIQGRLFCCFLYRRGKIGIGLEVHGGNEKLRDRRHFFYIPAYLPCRLTRSADHKSPQLFVFVAVTHATLPWWQTSPQNVVWFLDKHHLNCLTGMICPVVSVLDWFFYMHFLIYVYDVNLTRWLDKWQNWKSDGGFLCVFMQDSSMKTPVQDASRQLPLTQQQTVRDMLATLAYP